MMTATEAVTASTVWVRRVRLALATLIIWAGLHYVVGGYLLPRGLERPIVLVGAYQGPLAGILFVVLFWFEAAVATLVSGARDQRIPLIVLGLAVALWAFEGGSSGGTIDQWLRLKNETHGPPTAAPYRALLGDYLYLLIALAGAYAIATWLTQRPAAGGGAAGLWRTIVAPSPGIPAHEGPAALVITTAVAGVVTFVLMGPATGRTLRGQVYFAVGLGFVVGVLVATRLVKCRQPLWFAAAPLLLGVIGAVVASAAPTLRLPPEYRQLNVIPAWALVRPLPVEMVGVGLVAALGLLPRAARPPTAER